jgi:molybdenum cofactor biosynthesis enzyme MoaA
MGALPIAVGKTLTTEQIDHLSSEFRAIGLPSVAITGGEPFVPFKQLLRCLDAFSGVTDVSKLTTNAFWGTEKLCERTVARLIDHGLLRNRLFVPLLLLSIGEQSTPLDRVCRIIRHVRSAPSGVVSRVSERVSSPGHRPDGAGHG